MARIAVFQMTSGIDPEANLAAIEERAHQAAAEGAQILFTPEMAILLDRDRKRAGPWIESSGPARAAQRLNDCARVAGIDIALGSMPVAAGSDAADLRWANRAMYFRQDADPVIYDKMHMFDVELSTGETWRESSAYRAGGRVVTAENTPVGRLGFAICYDMRFPALFEELGKRQCDAITIPAAFTVPTGKAHWHVLLRARAIEASAFVIAAAQVGAHADGRRTYGHSLVIDPWGEVLLDMGGEGAGHDGAALGFCEIDLSRIAETRAQVPSLANRREIPNSVAP